MSNLLNKLKKNSKLDMCSELENSTLFNNRDEFSTDVPIINLALSGRFDGGMKSGLLQIAGPSKHFKSNLGLLLVSSFMKEYPDGVLLFYDSEFGATKKYFENQNVDPSRVLHCPIVDIEALKFDIVNQLNNLTKEDKVMIMIDSVGNLASAKEVQDALDEKSAADMTRAKALKSLFRIVTPHLSLKDIPMVVINHTYKEMALYPKDIVGGGCLAENTKIKMADGTLKEIQNIKIGEMVLTTTGPRAVTATWNPDTLNNGTPECFRLTFDDGFSVVCSDNHPFLINNKDGTVSWIKAKDLTYDMDFEVL